MNASRCFPSAFPLALVAASLLVAGTARGGDVLLPLEVRNVKVGGEIGRRIEATIDHNLLAINVDRDFLAPFHQPRKASDGYIGQIHRLGGAPVRL